MDAGAARRLVETARSRWREIQKIIWEPLRWWARAGESCSGPGGHRRRERGSPLRGTGARSANGVAPHRQRGAEYTGTDDLRIVMVGRTSTAEWPVPPFTWDQRSCQPGLSASTGGLPP
jgi:hypothetical protein